jgi:outer membrane protein assembly factor BamB
MSMPCRFFRHLTAVLIISTGSSLLTKADDWPQYLGPHRDGTSAATGLNWNWPSEGPPVVWSREVGAGFAGVVVADEKVILFQRIDNEEVVEQLDAATGKPLWTFAYRTRYVDDFGFDPGPRATPLVADGRVFTLGANGDLHGLDAASGAKRWHRNLLAEYGANKGYFGVACSPLLADGLLLVNVGGKRAGIVAFDPATGNEVWKATDDAASYSSPTLGTIGGKQRAVFFTRAGLQALDPKTGAVAYSYPWRSRLDASVNAATPLVYNGDVFLTASYGTGAVLLRPTGNDLAEVWSNDRSLSSHYNTPVRTGEFLYGVHGRQEGGAAQLRCVAWATGEVKWSRPRFGCASLIAVDGGLLAVTEGGELVRFDADPAKYVERGRVKILNSVTRAAPALAEGRLFVRDSDRLVCLNLRRK